MRTWLPLLVASIVAAPLGCVGDDPSSTDPRPDASDASSPSPTPDGGSAEDGSAEAGGARPGDLDAEYPYGERTFSTGTRLELHGLSVDGDGGIVLVGSAVGGNCGPKGSIGLVRLDAAGTPLLPGGATCWSYAGITENMDGLAAVPWSDGGVVAIGTTSRERFQQPSDPAAPVGAISLVRLGPDGAVREFTPSLTHDVGVPGQHLRPYAATSDGGSGLWIAGSLVDPRQTAAARAFLWHVVLSNGFTVAGAATSDSRGRYVGAVGADAGTVLAGAASGTELQLDAYDSATLAAPTPSVIPYEGGTKSALYTLAGNAEQLTFAAGVGLDEVGLSAAVTLARFTPTGPDLAFGTNGVLRVDGARVDGTSTRNAAVDAAGRTLVLATNDAGQPVVWRFTRAGAADATFGVDGRAVVTFPNASATPNPHGFLATDVQSRILLVFPMPGGYYVARLRP